MTRKKYLSLLLAALFTLGMMQDAQAVGILRPNIQVRDKTGTQQPGVSTQPSRETNTNKNDTKERVVISTKPNVKQDTNVIAKQNANTSAKKETKAEPKTTAIISRTKQAAQANDLVQNFALDGELASMLGDKGTQVPGLGVVAYKNSKKIYENYGGRRYISEDKLGDLPFTKDSRFRVGTISQTLVALATLQLVDQGKLNLDEDISKYLGFTLRNPHNADIKITTRMLMAHTSSLRDGSYDGKRPWQEIFASSKGMFGPKDQKTGEYFHYANVNYRVLATILEKVSNTRFDLFMKNGILKDLNIKGSYNICDFKTKEQKLLGGVYQKQTKGTWDENGAWVLQMDDYTQLKGHKNTEFFVQPAEASEDAWLNLLNYKIGENASVFVPECGLRASLDELSHLLEMIFAQGTYMNKQVLNEKTLEEMFKIHWFYDDWDKTGETYGGLFEAYGFGVMPYFNGSTTRLTTVKDHQWWGQIGDSLGIISGLVIDRRTKSGYVYLANGQAMNWSDSRSRGKFSKHIIWQENINDAICRNLFKD
ncbi:MAG: serine hydrolase domain-containing protein [Phascolarctobacterium sp.]|nr:serine hydrolase domain-containing protein [Phascolarctobacterium sp.]